MRTLKNFIDHTEEFEIDYEKYEVIENERLTDRILSGINVSGALFSLSTFKGVIFKNVDFFATRFENCEFINCKFINCNFQFSTIVYSDFHHSKIRDCNMETSPIHRSHFAHCDLDDKSLFYIEKGGNRLLANGEEAEVTGTFIMEKIAA